MSTETEDLEIRKPRAGDGLEIHRLIASSPPLDINSIYSYYLLADHFRDSCVVAESSGKLVGFISAYRIPNRADTLFVWQVVVDEVMRGKKLASRMLDALLQGYEDAGVAFVEATVNPSNAASRGLFERLARQRGSSVQVKTYLEASAFGDSGEHESELLLRVPLSKQNC
jgi:L-2,4-diaminobutyric acid acetyltransferase